MPNTSWKYIYSYNNIDQSRVSPQVKSYMVLCLCCVREAPPFLASKGEVKKSEQRHLLPLNVRGSGWSFELKLSCQIEGVDTGHNSC